MPAVVPLRRVALLLLSTFAVLGLVALLSVRDSARAEGDYPINNCTVDGGATTQSVNAVRVTGNGFPANSTVSLRTNTGAIARVRSDGAGSFRAAVAVGAGQRIVSASSKSVECTPGGVGSEPNQSGGSDVGDKQISRGQNSDIADPTATTGFAALSATALALTLLGGGTAFVLIGRRRRIG